MLFHEALIHYIFEKKPQSLLKVTGSIKKEPESDTFSSITRPNFHVSKFLVSSRDLWTPWSKKSGTVPLRCHFPNKK